MLRENMITSICKVSLFFRIFVHISISLNECGSGINLCEITLKMPWTKCFEHNCHSTRIRYTLRCCGNMHITECYKVCNITDEDLIIREPCAPRCVNGVLESGKCKCYHGYAGNCCGRYILPCCGNMHKEECYKVCNITDENLILREHCAPRCVNGFLNSGKCKCNKGYFGNCCDACPPVKYCENGGTCSMIGSNKTCYCTAWYHGNRCQHNGPPTTATTMITTKSMFTIKQTNATTFMTSKTPMTKAAKMLTTILGSTSTDGSSTRRHITHTKPSIKYQHTTTTTDTAQTLPKSFGTTKTTSPWRIICISVGIVLAFILMFVLILFVYKRLKSMIECAPVRD